MLSTLTYGNRAVVGYNYDGLDRVTEKLYNWLVKFGYKYDKSGTIVYDGNGTPASKYMALFSGYDIMEVWP